MKKSNEQKKKEMRIAITYGAVGIIALAAIAVGIVNRGEKAPKINLNATPTPISAVPAAGDGQNPKGQKTPGSEQNPGKAVPGQTAQGRTEQGGSEHQGQTVGQAEGNRPGGTKNETSGTEVALGDKKTDTEPKQTAGQTTGDKSIGAETQVAGNDSAKESSEAPVESGSEVPVINPDSILSGLSFSAQTGMLWPVTGEALVSFSPDHLIYNKTLDSYRTTDYVVLSGAVGTQVCAAAEGVVTTVSEELRTGTTITMRVAENYEIVYGLLSDVAVKEGDRIQEGTVIARISEPTRYFVEEGSGLYLKVLENGAPVNPMLFLRENE